MMESKEKELSEIDKIMKDPERAKRFNEEYDEIARIEWEIRAAKALRWEWSQAEKGFMHLPEEHLEEFIIGSVMVAEDIMVEELKFTTSYNWTMLGVNSLTLKQFTEYDGMLYDIVCKDLDMGHPIEARWAMSTATAQQMTEAWVRVLEGKE